MTGVSKASSRHQPRTLFTALTRLGISHNSPLYLLEPFQWKVSIGLCSINSAMGLDPLSALSLVGTIVQFVDFGSKLVSRSQELYRSANGSLSVNEELDLATQTLIKLVAKLLRYHKPDELPESNTGDYQSLVNLCESCTQVAEEILAKLKRLKISGKPRRWKSIQQAVKSCWTERELDVLFQRLATMREALETHIVVELRWVRP